MAKTPQIGESFLRDEGIYDEVTATAIKRTLTLQIEQEMAGAEYLEIEDGAPDENERHPVR